MYPRTIPPMCGWNIEGLNEDDRLLWQDILWKSSNYGKRVRSNVVLRSFRFSMIWALSIQYWIDHRSYQWRKSNMIPGVVQYVPLNSSLCLSFSSAVKPPQCCISWRLFLGIRRAPSDQVMTLWRMQHTISAIHSAPSFLSICLFMDQQWIDPLPRSIMHHWT